MTDTKRLNWLESHKYRAWSISTQPRWENGERMIWIDNTLISSDAPSEFKTLRMAIDAAMKKEPRDARPKD